MTTWYTTNAREISLVDAAKETGKQWSPNEQKKGLR